MSAITDGITNIEVPTFLRFRFPSIEFYLDLSFQLAMCESGFYLSMSLECFTWAIPALDNLLMPA